MTTNLDVLRLEQNVRDAYERLAKAHIDLARHLNKKDDGTEGELARARDRIEAARADIERGISALAEAISNEEAAP